MNRRRFLRKATAGGATLAALPVLYHLNTAKEYVPVISGYTRNPDLPDLLSADAWPGTPTDQQGLFINEEFPFWPRFSELLKWQTQANPYKAQKKDDTAELPVIRHQELADIPDSSLLWLGHATFLIKLGGVTLLIDPVLGSPSSLMKRYSALPFPPEALTGIDFILLSHNHRDHCDETSIKQLAKQNPNTTWLTGLKLNELLQKWTGSTNIQAAGWYQQYKISQPDIRISCLPSRHWSRRGFSDTNYSLWGAFLIEAGGKKIYFGGDSGYGHHVKKVRELFGEVDYYLAGIGAFAPRWFMGASHMHPEEAARASNELGPKHFIPMHYGTFDLSDEPRLEPLRLISELKQSGALDSNLLMPAVGEIVLL